MERSASNQLIEEIDRLHSKYEKEIERQREKGIKLKTRGRQRAGWWQAGKLSDPMEKIFNRYLHMDEEEIEKDIRKILGLGM